MSTPIAPSRLSPSSQERAFKQERSIERMEATHRHLVSHIGFWAALLTAVLGIAWYIAAFADLILGLLPYPWGLVAQCTPSLLLAPAFVVLLVCVQQRTPLERRIWSSIAVPFGAVYAALCATVYFVELTLVCKRQEDSEQRAIAKLSHLLAIQSSGRWILFL